MPAFFKYVIMLGLVVLLGCGQTKPAVITDNKTDGQKKEETKKEEEFKPFNEITAGAEISKGLFTIYRKKDRLYCEIRPEQFPENYLLIAGIEKGIGEGSLLAGSPLDTDILVLKRIENKVLFFKRNTFFRADPGAPEEHAVKRAFSDSLMGTLNIVSINPETRGVLVDLTALFISDVSSIADLLKKDFNYALNKEGSYLSDVRNFPENIELTFRYNYSSRQARYEPVVPDTKSIELGVHYSFSRLPDSSGYYQPRLADDRVGYFTVSVKNFSSPDPKTPYLHYIERWHLEKADPSAELSPPKKPIVFWIDKATPHEFREAVKDGILMWNRAFAKAGFKDAIQVRVQPDNAEWDAADSRYNVILWLTSHSSPFAGRGPARTNPLTGEILDADIQIDGESCKRLGRLYQYFVTPLSGNGLSQRPPNRSACTFSQMSAEESGLGLLAMLALDELEPGEPVPKDFLDDHIKQLIGHEVGHVLGLRHNFKGSLLHQLKDLDNKKLVSEQGLSASIMDYLAIYYHPKEIDTFYFTPVVGPYDCWAIEYGYRPVKSASPEEESVILREIAVRQGTDPALAYGEDGDTDLFDPEIHRGDLGRDPFEFARHRVLLQHKLIGRLSEKILKSGDPYSELRLVFNSILRAYGHSSLLAARYVGGMHFRRDHLGDAARNPLEIINVKRQKEALDFLHQNIFSDDLYDKFPPDLLNKLPPGRTPDWPDEPEMNSAYYPLHQIILRNQKEVLNYLLSQRLLNAIHNARHQFASEEPVFTLADLYESLTWGLWSELKPAAGSKLQVSPFRLNLQREYVTKLIEILETPVNPEPQNDFPAEARTLSWKYLKDLKQIIDDRLVQLKGKIDVLTQAHLEETSARIDRTLFGQPLKK